MTEFKLTYARTVILEAYIEAPTADAALAIAAEMESTGELGLADWKAKEGSEVRDVVDDDTIWEVERVS